MTEKVKSKPFQVTSKFAADRIYEGLANDEPVRNSTPHTSYSP